MRRDCSARVRNAGPAEAGATAVCRPKAFDCSQRRPPHVAVTSVQRADQERTREEKGLIRSKRSGDVDRSPHARDAEAARTVLNRPSAQRCRIPRGNEDPGSYAADPADTRMRCMPAGGWRGRRVAQPAGRLAGVVRDATGSVLPGVTLTVAGPALGEPRTVVTDEHGQYVLDSLPEGRYLVTATFSVFEPRTTEVQVVLVR